MLVTPFVREEYRYEEFSALSREEAQDKNDWRLKIQGGTWLDHAVMAVKTMFICV